MRLDNAINSWINAHPHLKRIIDSGFAFIDRNQRVLLVFPLVGLDAIVVALFLWGTAPHGIGIRTDSVAYLWSAKNLANGVGLGMTDAFGQLRPLNHFPPLYPILLAVFDLIGIDGMVGARWLGAFFIGTLILLDWLILFRLSNRSFWLPSLGVLVLFFIPAFWDTGIYAMTEPLFLAFCLLGFICLDNYATGNKRRWLWSAAALLALSFLTRYIGISVAVTGVVFILAQKNMGARKKVLDSILLGTISVFPIAIWLIRNIILTGTATNRGINFVPITAQEWSATADAFMTWIEPARAAIKVNLAGILIFLLALVISFMIFNRREVSVPRPARTQLPLLLAIFAAVYILLTIASRLWADPSIPLYEDRILYPFMVSLFFLALYFIPILLRMVAKHSIFLTAILTGIFVMIAWGFVKSNSSVTFPYIRPVLHSHVDGLGLQYQTSLANDFVKSVAQLPNNTLLFTDNPEKLYFFTGRPSSYIGDFTLNDLRILQEQMSNHQAAVIYFNLSPENQQILQHQIPQLKLIFSDDGGRLIYLEENSR
jgi:4-amino-4-deoxy-L-arabinose transferase-like glycosyltransferase